MPLRLFNTLSRRLEEFQPLHPPKVTLYTCGPTVWNYAHIGNFRSFVFEDVLRRYLAYRGYDVLQVMNVTDVDDRTIKAAGAAGVPLIEHVKPFTQAFFEDRDYLRILPAHHYPTATGHVPEMIALIERLLAKGVAYKGEDGSVYFAIGKFPTYGRLSRVESRELKAGARVDSDEYSKDDARDFALWKATDAEDEAVGAAWDAPFGRGRPGWHLECSAMAMKYLGETLDVHCGGVDLIFPHHENEIAQSEAASGKPFARTWMHGEFLQIDGTKMSKRYGNFLTARDLKDSGWDAAAIRFLFGQTHYRKQLNWTDDALKGAAAGAARLAELRQRLTTAPAGASSALGPLAAAMEEAFRSAMDEDLDVPNAIAGLMTFVRDANAALDAGAPTAAAKATTSEAFARVTDVLQVVPPPRPEDNPYWAEKRAKAEALAAERWRAKERKDFARADQLRIEIRKLNFVVHDKADGYELRLAPPPGAG